MNQFSFQQCLDAHVWYKSQDQLTTLTWLCSVIAASNNIHNHYFLHFNKFPVCCTAFKKLYGIFNSKFAHAKHLADSSSTTLLLHGNTGNLHAANTSHQVLAHTWCSNFINDNGDVDPATGNIHIPCYVTHDFLYEMFIDAHSSYSKKQLPNKSSFLEYFRSHFPTVKFLKRTHLGQCTFCVTLQ